MSRKKKIAVLASLFAAAGIVTATHRARAKNANEFQLLTGFSSKETCSCAFVVDQTDDFCKAFGQFAGYDGLVVSIDRSAKTASSSIAGVTRTSRFEDAKGCTLDALP